MESGRIKKFKNFKVKDSYHKLLNYLVITGTYKYGIFSKRKPFKLEVYSTPIKGKIAEIKCDTPDMEFPFKLYDNVDLVKAWASNNNYEIEVDRKRI